MKNKKGFTLVELLAVIVILGVLLLVAVPSVTTIQTKAKQNAADDQALMVLKAIETCNMAETDVDFCDTTDLASYYEGSTDAADLSYSVNNNGKLTAFKVIFNGYTVQITSSTGNTINEVRSAINDHVKYPWSDKTRTIGL